MSAPARLLPDCANAVLLGFSKDTLGRFVSMWIPLLSNCRHILLPGGITDGSMFMLAEMPGGARQLLGLGLARVCLLGQWFNVQVPAADHAL